MSSKFLHSVTDENPDLRKHIGCMNGIFQLFDRHHFASRRRIGGGDNPKRLSAPGQSVNHGMRPNSTTNRTKERSLKEEVKERQRVSVESSRTSLSSSSCSSTFSSVDYNRTAKPEASSSCQSISPETPSLTSTSTSKQSNPSSRSGQQSFNLRDVVKDSIYREPRRLPIKTIAKEEGLNQVVKYVDSPRPLPLCRPDKTKFCGPSETLQALDRRRNTPWNSNEGRYGPLPLTPKDAPRLSYDGRESRDILRSNIKLKELPRLSLDSRAGSIRSSAAESRSNYLLGDIQQVKQDSNEPGSNKRPSNVVARLMGLEAFPDSMSTDEDQIKEIKSHPDEHFDAISRLSRIVDKSRKNQVSGSPRLSQGDPASPQLRNINSVMKPTLSSRFPVEAAPWRQPQSGRGSKKLAFIHGEATNSCSSVYGEIEKRLTELEFKKSGKDLRALKQILAAMQKTRKRLENQKEEHASNFESQTSSCSQNYSSSLDQRSKSTTQRSQGSNLPKSPTIKGSIPPKRLESPIVIIKPAKLIDNSRNSGSSSNPGHRISSLHKLQTGDSADTRKEWNFKQTAADVTLGKNHLTDPSSRSLHSMSKSIIVRTPRSTQTSKVDQHMMRQNLTRPGKSSGTMSPRLQQMKHEMEKRSHPTTPSYDSNKARQQNSKQPMESGSVSRKLKPKSPRQRHGDDRLSEISNETGNLSPQGDAASVQSESNISSISQIETEITSSDCSNQINGIRQQDQKDKNLDARLSKDKPLAELTTANLEQPSPVSVLDATFYKEDPPSPLKKISNAFKDNETLMSNEAEEYRVDRDHLLNSTRANLNCEFDHTNSEDVKQLVCKLKRLDFTDARSTAACIASLHENTSQDHVYIAEILSASGFLLKDLSHGPGTIQPHPSGSSINPNLYFALEQTKGSTEFPNDEHSTGMSTGSKSREKIRRKLIFDTVNQILACKLASPVSSEAWVSPNKLGGRSWSGQKLLEEVCSVIDGLQEKKDSSLYNEDDWLISILTEDMMHQPENWTDYSGEVAGAVLDIERLIFKDLITEILSTASQAKN